jgi:hypothetical protein
MIDKILTIILLAFSLSVSGCQNDFPSKAQIDVFMAKFKEESIPFDKKAKRLEAFLENLSSPETIEDDARIKYALDRLFEIYESTNDEAILIAIDNTEIDGGFANYICIFYKKISTTSGFHNRYSDPALWKAIYRCAGLSFSEKEVMELFQSNVE